MTGRDGKVYVVDDDEGVRELLDALLSAAGYDTVSFASAAEFLQRFDPTTPPAFCSTCACPAWTA